MSPPRDVFVRERDAHFSVVRGGNEITRICAGRVRGGTGFHVYHGTAGILWLASSADVCDASDAFTHLIRNATQICSFLAFGVSCSCLQVKRQRSVGGCFCFLSLFVRGVFVREWDRIPVRSLCAGRVCAETGFTLFRGARTRDIIICAGLVCGATGFHIHHGTTRISRIPYKTVGYPAEKIQRKRPEKKLAGY